MQRFFIFLAAVTLSVLVSACDGAPPHTHVAAEEPRLQEFQVIDSYGYIQEPGYIPVLDPSVNRGVFEVFWRVDSFYDYWVTVALNDRPSMAGSIILSEELCGYDLSCDYDGTHVCAYDADFYMGCGADLYEAELNMVDIYEPFIYELPEPLYLNIQVCDETGLLCEVSSRPVDLY